MNTIKRCYWWMASQVCGLVGWCFYHGERVDGIALKLNSKSYRCWCRYYLLGLKK